MAILQSPESEYSRERVKWEAGHTECGPGQRPFVYREYPKMLYKAGRTSTGVPTIIDRAEVENATQEQNLRSRGFCQGQDKALELLHEQDQAVAVAAAERAYSDRKMSPAAQIEAQRIDDRTASHLAEIPAQPLPPRKRGPKPKEKV